MIQFLLFFPLNQHPYPKSFPLFPFASQPNLPPNMGLVLLLILISLNATLIAILTARLLRVALFWGLPAGLIAGFHLQALELIRMPEGLSAAASIAMLLTSIILFDRYQDGENGFLPVLQTYTVALVWGAAPLFSLLILILLSMFRRRFLPFSIPVWSVLGGLALLAIGSRLWLDLFPDVNYCVTLAKDHFGERFYAAALATFTGQYGPVATEFPELGWLTLSVALIAGPGRWRLWGPTWFLLSTIPLAIASLCGTLNGAGGLYLASLAAAFSYGMMYRAIWRRSAGVLRIILMVLLWICLGGYILSGFFCKYLLLATIDL